MKNEKNGEKEEAKHRCIKVEWRGGGNYTTVTADVVVFTPFILKEMGLLMKLN